MIIVLLGLLSPDSIFVLGVSSLSMAKSIEIFARDCSDRAGLKPKRKFQRPLTGYQWVKSWEWGGDRVTNTPVSEVIIPPPMTAPYPLEFQGGEASAKQIELNQKKSLHSKE
jgi:hypothetical protein